MSGSTRNPEVIRAGFGFGPLSVHGVFFAVKKSSDRGETPRRNPRPGQEYMYRL